MTDIARINIIDNTPKVTIVDNLSGSIVVTDNNQSVTISSNQPTEVIVHNGIGNGYDENTVVSLLAERITDAMLSPALLGDIANIRDLWLRVGNQIILTNQDKISIEESSTVYTDSKIANTVAALDVVDGKVDLNISTISQEASRIDSNVTSLDIIGPNLALAQSDILQTTDRIDSVVSRMTLIDGPGGTVELAQSSISQHSGSIASNVLDIKKNGDDVLETNANLAITNENITGFVTRLNTAEDSINTARTELTSTTALTSVTSSSLTNTQASLKAVETMTANRWGVTVAEDAGGTVYATGIGLVLHPDWAETHTYAVDDYVYFFDSGVGSVYRCLIAHTSSVLNNPVGVDGATYWSIDSEGKKTSFNIKADQLKLVGPTSTVPMFSVTGDSFTLGSDIALKSSNYGVAGQSWYGLNAATGLAEFNNMTMTFTDTAVRDTLVTDLGIELGATLGATWDVNIDGSNLPASGATVDLTLVNRGLATNATVEAFTIKKLSTGFNSAISSLNPIIGECYASCRIGTSYLVFGITPAVTASNEEAWKYSIKCYGLNGFYEVWESGIRVAWYFTPTTASQANDVISIVWDETSVAYYVNGALLHTSTGTLPAVTDPLYLGVSVYTLGDVVNDIRFIPNSNAIFTDWKWVAQTVGMTPAEAVQLSADLDAHTSLISDLQDQVDGQVIYWFLDGRPVVDLNTYNWATSTVYSPDQPVLDSGISYTCVTGHTSGTFSTDLAAGYWVADVDAFNTAPFDTWGTDAIRDTHLGDLYYDNNSGLGFRLTSDGAGTPTYLWQAIPDSSAAALALAQQALDTADGKRRVFIATPLTSQAYDVGDLWDTGTTLRRCITAKLVGGTFALTHWSDIANLVLDTSEITDGANLGQTALWQNVALTPNAPADNADVTGSNTSLDTANVNGVLAATVQTNAASAKSAVDSMSADGIFSVQEKAAWRVQWPGMLANHDQVIAQATTYGIQGETVFTTYTAAKITLYNYLNSTHQIWAATPTDTTISGDLLKTNTTNFYDKMQLAVNRIADYAHTAHGVSDGADSTQGALQTGTTITGGGITLSAGGNIKGGQTSYGVGSGFFMGYESGAYKLSVGNANSYITYDGYNNVAIKANVTITNPEDFADPNADQTQSALQAGTIITGGGVTLHGGTGKFVVKDAAGHVRVKMGYLL